MKHLYTLLTAILIIWGFIVITVNIMRPHEAWEALDPQNRTYRVIAGGVFFLAGIILLQRKRPQ